MIRISASILILLPLVSCSSKETGPPLTDHPKGYVCYRTGSPVIVDGRMDESGWERAEWTEPFVDIEGARKPEPRFRTRAKMLWDDSCMYIGANLEEPHVWATITKRDSVIFHDNDFEIFIDPNGDNHEYYELEINALNTLWDLFLPKPYKDGGSAVDEWNVGGIRTAVFVEGTLNDAADRDSGWSVEFAIPWAALGEYAHSAAPPHEGDRWRLNFSRVEWQHQLSGSAYSKIPGLPEDNWVWSPQGLINMHYPEMWGYVQFTSSPPGSVVFAADDTFPSRMLLHSVYNAQRRFREKQGRWATTLEELKFVPAASAGTMPSPVLESTPDGFTVTVDLPDSLTGKRRLHIRHDSMIWSDHP
jgi:hypothetical protein